MSHTERLKAEIAFHEKMFFTSIAVIVATIGWTTEKASAISENMHLSALITIMLVTGFSIWNYRKIRTLLKELENAE